MWEKDGFVQDEADVNTVLHRLENYIQTFPENLKKFSSEEILKRPAENKWSKKEILGHLIDSGINNLKRFAEAQFLSQPYKVIRYQQAELVIVNDYQNIPLDHLLELWQCLNRQIIFVVKNIPNDKLNLPVDPQYENKELRNLGWIICDYVAHMEHHFRQIFPVA